MNLHFHSGGLEFVTVLLEGASILLLSLRGKESESCGKLSMPRCEELQRGASRGFSECDGALFSRFTGLAQQNDSALDYVSGRNETCHEATNIGIYS
jgi:hypothetical protein